MFPVPAPIHRRGVTLIEAVLFISVALGLIVGGIVFYQQATLSSRVNASVRELSALVQETRALLQNTDLSAFGVDLVASTLITDDASRIDNILVASGAAPAHIIVEPRPLTARMPNSRFRTPWDGELSLAIGIFPFTNTYAIKIAMADVPPEVCLRLAPMTDGTNRFTDGILLLFFESPGSGAAIAAPLDLTPSEAAGANRCSVAGQNPVHMSWIMFLD